MYQSKLPVARWEGSRNWAARRQTLVLKDAALFHGVEIDAPHVDRRVVAAKRYKGARVRCKGRVRYLSARARHDGMMRVMTLEDRIVEQSVLPGLGR